ncbi:MAG: pyridoxamine 5'-phosphate oxidase family protein [Deltaproteobacteria bacterium]|nr:pyridoxamine 5'-phosphate oxidase family protein [Deltaproteobacteria bacterium]MBW2401569.1 pyridoxamine 5'-phosphate oxidase family protein [Deltaproteobacteria bacterium]
MTQEEREAFLAEVHVGVIGLDRRGRAPLTVPIWYIYEPGGELWIMVESDSAKQRLIERAGRFSLCVQSETPPYKFVSIEGPVTNVRPSDKDRDERLMAHRYLGEKLGDVYIEVSKTDPTNRPGLIVTMRPETWFTSDFGKQWTSTPGD